MRSSALLPMNQPAGLSPHAAGDWGGGRLSALIPPVPSLPGEGGRAPRQLRSQSGAAGGIQTAPPAQHLAAGAQRERLRGRGRTWRRRRPAQPSQEPTGGVCKRHARGGAAGGREAFCRQNQQAILLQLEAGAKVLLAREVPPTLSCGSEFPRSILSVKKKGESSPSPSNLLPINLTSPRKRTGLQIAQNGTGCAATFSGC